jgi:FkbM family methyltransferase
LTNLPVPADGVFIDVGANDGITGSNTFAFERKGWTGVAIEPDPRHHEHLRRNRDCEVLPYAIGTDPSAVFHLTSDPGMSGFQRNGPPLKVPVRTLAEALEEAHIERVDLLSIDTEGTELDVWASFDPAKYSPAILIIEWNTTGLPDRSDDICREILKHPYRVAEKTSANFIFIRDQIF